MNGDDLGWNKIFGAILGTALLILALKQGAEMIYAPHPPKVMGDAIAVAADASDSGAPAADVPPDWGTVLPKADVAAGLVVSAKCASCHSFANGGPNGTGPDNWGVIGRDPGTHPGFAYSSSMVDFGKAHATWTYDELYTFLASPSAYISGTKMGFVGLKKPEDRINLIAWLRQQSSSPAPIPAPNPKAAAAATAAGPASTPATPNGVATPAKGAAGASAPVAASGGSATGTSGQTGTGAATAPSGEKTAPGAPPK